MYLTLQISMMIGLFFFLANFFSGSIIMTLLTNEAERIAIGTEYLRLTSFSYLFMSFSQIYMIIMKNTDMAKRSSIIGGFSAVCNIVLNYVLIYPAHFA